MLKFIVDSSTVQTMNFLDMAIVAIFVYSIFSAYKKGFVKSFYNLFSIFIGLFLSDLLYPFVSNYLRSSKVYFDIKSGIINSLDISGAISGGADTAINSLNLPDFLKMEIMKMNTPQTYEILGVNNLEEYIATYFANILINIMGAIIVFMAVIIIMKILTISLDIVCKLPIIRSFNKGGGIIIGIVSGFVLCYIFLTVYTLFFIKPETGALYTLNNSLFAIYFYENNPILDFFIRFKTWYNINEKIC